ncbi:MAG: enoyl-CoA hydratase/isomerase family protein [Flavobacteriales bacterium]|nr:enoyl-CoA hydratase/isomerase family protein [Flavobacteriales bacterium]
MGEQGGVEMTIDSGIATITFYHPKSNSLPGKVLKELAATIESAGTQGNVRVIVLTSSGEKAFCAGASFDELLSIADADTGKDFFMGFARVINAARKCPRFIIGRVQGKAVGGGVGMAAAVDYCMAVDQASVKLSELAIGIGPFVVGPAVERKMGLSAFSELAINATEWRDAQWAYQKGLYTRIFSSVGELNDAVTTLAKRLSDSSPEAMKLLKQAMWSGTENWDQLLESRAEMSGKLVLSDFTSNAIRQFKEGTKTSG